MFKKNSTIALELENKSTQRALGLSRKFESSAFAFVCFEISTLLKLEISKHTNAKADDSN